MGEGLTLRSAISILRSRAAWAIGVMAFVAMAAIAYGLLQPKQYEATAILLAGQERGIGDLQSIVAINQATQSLGARITDRVVVEQAADEIDYEGDIRELLKRVSAEVPANTQAIELTVVDTDPEVAARLANAIAREFSDLIDKKASSESNLSAVVWQEAIPPRDPSSPNMRLLAALGLATGLMLGIGVAFLREYLYGGWRSEEDVELRLDIPVLSTIPDVSRRGSRNARRQVYG